MKMYDFVLDTNIWISLILNNQIETSIEVFHNKNIKIYICPELFNEIEDVLKRKKITKFLLKTPQFYLDLISKSTYFQDIVLRYNIAPDPDDNYLFDLCINSNSTLVTGDKLLLEHDKVSEVKIISFSKFKSKLLQIE